MKNTRNTRRSSVKSTYIKAIDLLLAALLTAREQRSVESAKYLIEAATDASFDDAVAVLDAIHANEGDEVDEVKIRGKDLEVEEHLEDEDEEEGGLSTEDQEEVEERIEATAKLIRRERARVEAKKKALSAVRTVAKRRVKAEMDSDATMDDGLMDEDDLGEQHEARLARRIANQATVKRLSGSRSRR